jgi:hypothetical protein
LLGVEWVSLELAARFAPTPCFESYFGWDPARFPGRGEHNLVRARGQWSLHQACSRRARPRVDLSSPSPSRERMGEGKPLLGPTRSDQGASSS